MFLVLIAPPGTIKADGRQYAVVARINPKGAGLAVSEVALTIGDISVPATAIRANADLPRNIAIVMDTGPDQKNVLSREKELAVAVINEFSDGSTIFTITTAGALSELQATPDSSVAIERIRSTVGASGVKANVPIYDPIASAIRLISRSPGLRIVVFIGEGNDGGSRMRYPELRSLAESNQIAFFAALVADHSLRGSKSILRYGWNLRELTSDTAGIFLENRKTLEATQQLTATMKALRLISFELPLLPSGRYRVSVSGRQRGRFRAQKAMIIP